MSNNPNQLNISSGAVTDQINFWNNLTADFTAATSPLGGVAAMALVHSWASQPNQSGQTTNGPSDREGGHYLKLLATRSDAGNQFTNAFTTTVQGLYNGAGAFCKDQALKVQNLLKTTNGKLDSTNSNTTDIAGTGMTLPNLSGPQTLPPGYSPVPNSTQPNNTSPTTG